MLKLLSVLTWFISHLTVSGFPTSSSDEGSLCHGEEELTNERKPLSVLEDDNDPNESPDITDEDENTSSFDSDLTTSSENTSESETEECDNSNNWFVEKYNESNPGSYSYSGHVYDENYGISTNSYFIPYYLETIPEVDEVLYDSDVLYVSFDTNDPDEVSADENSPYENMVQSSSV